MIDVDHNGPGALNTELRNLKEAMAYGVNFSKKLQYVFIGTGFLKPDVLMSAYQRDLLVVSPSISESATRKSNKVTKKDTSDRVPFLN